MNLQPSVAPRSDAPLVWYVAAGYSRSAGIEVYILNYATEMRRRGFDTKVVVFEPLPLKSHRCLDALHERGIPICSLGDTVRGKARCRASLAGLVDLFRNRRTDREGRLRWASKKAEVAELRRWIQEDRPHVIHVQGRLMAEAWPVLPPERTVFHLATAGAKDDSWDASEVEEFRSFVGRCARVFAPGSGVAERFKQDFGVTRDVDVIFTMAPDEWGTPDVRREASDVRRGMSHVSGPLRFGFLGRLHEEKGVRIILDALSLLRQQGLQVPFLFAGEGPMEDEMVGTEGVKRETGDVRRETGDVRRGEIVERESTTFPPNCVSIEHVESPARSLAKIDVVVLASRSEAMPLALVEGLMCGRPCIATDVGGIPDLIRNGVEGLLLRECSPVSLANAMRRFVKMSPEEYAGFAERARNRYEECCRPEVVGAMVESVYRGIVCG